MWFTTSGKVYFKTRRTFLSADGTVRILFPNNSTAKRRRKLSKISRPSKSGMIPSSLLVRTWRDKEERFELLICRIVRNGIHFLPSSYFSNDEKKTDGPRVIHLATIRRRYFKNVAGSGGGSLQLDWRSGAVWKVETCHWNILPKYYWIHLAGPRSTYGQRFLCLRIP